MYEELKKHATRAIPSGSTPKNDDGTSDAGTIWLMFELLWRDFFRFITKKYSKHTNYDRSKLQISQQFQYRLEKGRGGERMKKR